MSQIQTKFIANNAVTNAKLFAAPSNTIKGNNTGSSANVVDLSVAQAQSLLNITLLNDWATYTPTITGFGTVSAAKGSYKQIGDSLFLKIFFVAGTVTSTTATFTLPPVFTLATSLTKVPVANTISTPGLACGSYTADSNTNNNFGTWQGAIITAPGTSTSLIYAASSITDLTGLLRPANANAICDIGSAFTLQCELILQ